MGELAPIACFKRLLSFQPRFLERLALIGSPLFLLLGVNITNNTKIFHFDNQKQFKTNALIVNPLDDLSIQLHKYIVIIDKINQFVNKDILKCQNLFCIVLLRRVSTLFLGQVFASMSAQLLHNKTQTSINQAITFL